MAEIRANLVLKSSKGLFRLASIKETNDGTVIVTLPKLLMVSDKAEIDTSGKFPILANTSPISVNNIHASYHSKTGYKHIKVLGDQGQERVFTENAVDISEGYFEHLLRIVPSVPENHPILTVQQAKLKTVVLDTADFDNKPIGIVISVTDRKPDDIRIEAPEKSRGKYLKLNTTSIIIVATLATQNDKLLETWPKDTWWFSPYH